MKRKYIYGQSISYKDVGFKTIKEFSSLSQVIPLEYELNSYKAGDKVMIPAYIVKTKDGHLQLTLKKNISFKDIMTKYFETKIDE